MTNIKRLIASHDRFLMKKGPGPKTPSSTGSPLGNEKPRVYEKPLFEKSKGMVFTTEIWKKFNGGQFCMQCSSCHGCGG